MSIEKMPQEAQSMPQAQNTEPKQSEGLDVSSEGGASQEDLEQNNAEAPENIWKEAQENRSEKRNAAHEAEREVVDIAQEIGTLRQEIQETDGYVTQHEEKIAKLIDRLSVARSAFGNYGEETDMLVKKLEKLHEKMKHLQSHTQEKALSSLKEKMIALENELRTLEQKRKEGGNVRDIDIQLESKTIEHEKIVREYNRTTNGDFKENQPTAEQKEIGIVNENAAEGKEPEKSQSIELLLNNLDMQRDRVASLMDASEEERVVAMQDYVKARTEWIAEHPDGDDPRIRAELLARERRTLAHHVREHAGDGDPLDDKNVRAAENFLADIKKERKQMDDVLGKGRFNALVPEQFVNPDGSQMSPDKIREHLNEQLDAMQETLDARLRQENVSPSIATRIGRKLLAITGIAGAAKVVRDMYVSRQKILEARQAHEEWEKEQAHKRNSYHEEKTDNQVISTEEAYQENVKETSRLKDAREEERVQENTQEEIRLPNIEELNNGVKEWKDDHDNNSTEEEDNVPELTELINVKNMAEERIAHVLSEFGISTNTFREKMQDLPLKGLSTSVKIDSDTLQFMLLYVEGAIEDFGDNFDISKNSDLEVLSFGDYVMRVERTRVKNDLVKK